MPLENTFLDYFEAKKIDENSRLAESESPNGHEKTKNDNNLSYKNQKISITPASLNANKI